MSLSIQKLYTIAGQDAPIYTLEKFEVNSFFAGGGDRIVTVRNTSADSSSKALVNTGTTIYSINFISKKNILLIGVSSGGMHVIDLTQKKELHFLLLHQLGIYDIKYSHKHNMVITAGGDGKIGFWSADTFTFIRSFELCKEKVRTLVLDDEEKVLAVGCGDGTIRIFDLPGCLEMRTINAHNASVNVLAFHSQKKWLISGGRDAYLKTWQCDSYEEIKAIPAHNYAIYSLSFSPDNTLFATASRDKTIKIWNSEDLKIIVRIDKEKFDGHTHSVNKVLWLNDVLLSAGDDRKIIGWKIEKEFNV